MPNPPIRPLFSGPFWVASNGSDTVGDGTAGNPWRNPQKAADFIRTNRINQAQSADVVVNQRIGSYAPLALTTLDSGFNGHSVKYVSYDGVGTAVVDGGVQVVNWSSVGGGIFRAIAPPIAFNTLYENGVRADLCRLPKRVVNPSFPACKAPYFSMPSSATDMFHMNYSSSDFDPTGWSTSQLSVFQWTGDFNWFADKVPISAMDTVGHVLTYAQESKFYAAAASRYFVQGIQSMLTQAGEFWLDTSGGWIYYYPRSGDPNLQVILAPQAQEAITMTGKSTKAGDLVTNVVLDGLAVQDTDHVPWYRPGWSLNGFTGNTVDGPFPNPWPVGYIYAWVASMPQFGAGAIRLTNADTCTVTNCHVRNTGMHGIYATGWGKNHTISNCWVEHTALAGIRFEGQFPALGDILRNCTLYNLRINDPGELSSHGNIQLGNSGNHSISYCELYNSPRQGIWMFADNFGDGLTDTANQLYIGGTTIDHVLIRNCCQDSADVGALGFDSFGNDTGKHYHICPTSQVISHDNITDPRNSSVTPYPNGIFTDDKTYGQVFTNVWSYNNSDLPFRINDSGEHTYNNTSFQSDGSANPSFDQSQMDVANIGTTSGFPYP